MRCQRIGLYLLTVNSSILSLGSAAVVGPGHSASITPAPAAAPDLALHARDFTAIPGYSGGAYYNLPKCARDCVGSAQDGIQCVNANCLCSQINAGLDFVSACVLNACNGNCAYYHSATSLLAGFCTSVAEEFTFSLPSITSVTACAASTTVATPSSLPSSTAASQTASASTSSQRSASPTASSTPAPTSDPWPAWKTAVVGLAGALGAAGFLGLCALMVPCINHHLKRVRGTG